MAWSKAARDAALEARRRHAKPVTVTTGLGTTTVERSYYAKLLKSARKYNGGKGGGAFRNAETRQSARQHVFMGQQPTFKHYVKVKK